MTLAAAIKQGLRLARRARSAVWILFLANFVLAALAAWPVYHGILEFTGHSLMSQTLTSGFSVDWLTDFSFNRPGALARYSEVILYFGLLAVLLESVLAGGALASFRDPARRQSWVDFFHDCGLYAWRLVRLTIVGLICYWVVFRVLNQGLGSVISKWTAQWMDDRPVFWVKLVQSALVLLALGFINLVMDYARVRLVAQDGTSALEAFLASLGFSLSRLGRVFIVWAAPSLAGTALTAIYLLVAAVARKFYHPAAPGQTSEQLALAVLFVMQQATMWGRNWFRVATWGSEWSYYTAGR